MDAKKTTIQIIGDNNNIVFQQVPESKTWMAWIVSCLRWVSFTWLKKP